ncbi:MAG: tRNA lysidine(34) synthetase TilS [Actinomycetota bacterium]|jgi:tRNA(Ile)-lysidine synthase
MTERPRLTPAVADARRAVRELVEPLKLNPGSVVFVACSGGGDSIALAAAAAFELPKMGLVPAAAIIDHNLQQGSEVVAKVAAETCEQLGLWPVVIRKIEIHISGDGLEAAARDARYAELERIRIQEGGALILLGHNLEDQAETVLLGLARGSGLSAIAGMEQYDPARNLARPFLALTRHSLREACRDQNLKFWEDPHNADPKFARVRARNLLVQLESELGPGLAQALARTADQVAAAEEVITGLAAEAAASAKVSGTAKAVHYSVAALAAQPNAVRTKALHLISVRAGAKNVSSVQIEQIDALITNWHGQKSASLSGITVERVKDNLVFATTKTLSPGAC